ncbi:Chitin synthase, class 7 [Stygiomarasmius scandens]|uniref:Chitin synthase export chaperone n=1 Tax=Marasmiellus scandens TaxID=2682957 RepID=A0ABR1JKA5_9AGAR
MGFQFGSFDSVCQTAALVICPFVGTDQGIEPVCYGRNIDVGGSVVFQPSTVFIHVVAIVMTAIMIYSIQVKYTAIGRKEMVMFFWLYAIIQFLAIFLDGGIIPFDNASYPWFAAIYTGLLAAAYGCILINSFVGFQFVEDGTPLSLWSMRLSCLGLFGVGFFIAIATFKQFAGFSYTSPMALWIVYLIWPVVCVAVYIPSQLILVYQTLEDRWPYGDIFFGTGFYCLGMVLLFIFSDTICNTIEHYIDGIFFSEFCVLLSVMMIYKYWDSITKEDLEFSVGSKAAAWEVKDPLLVGGPEEAMNSHYGGNYLPPSASFNTSDRKGSGGYPPNGGY